MEGPAFTGSRSGTCSKTTLSCCWSRPPERSCELRVRALVRTVGGQGSVVRRRTLMTGGRASSLRGRVRDSCQPGGGAARRVLAGGGGSVARGGVWALGAPGSPVCGGGAAVSGWCGGAGAGGGVHGSAAGFVDRRGARCGGAQRRESERDDRACARGRVGAGGRVAREERVRWRAALRPSSVAIGWRRPGSRRRTRCWRRSGGVVRVLMSDLEGS